MENKKKHSKKCKNKNENNKEEIENKNGIDLAVVSTLNDFGVKIDNEANKPTEIEKKHVYEVYDKISEHFSHTRYKPWPLVSEFLNSIEEDSNVLDVGCGNGKYLNVNKKLNMFGTDRSGNLLKISQDKNENVQLFIADSLILPIKTNTFDACISIAVIHHFSNDILRIQAIKELVRVTRKNGKILIYVWALEQQEKKFSQQDNFVPWHLQNKYENETKVETLQGGPEIMDEKKIDCTIYQRYYHVFKKGELENLIIKSDVKVNIIKSYFDHANWCCILQKIE